MSRARAQARLLRAALRERVSRTERPRVPEPMIMDGTESVAAFHVADPIFQLPVYRYNATVMSKLLPENGVVLDLGSGSGQLLAHLAHARPDVRAVGTDLADTMLATGRAMLLADGLDDRVELREADMTDLGDVVPERVDLVSCVWALHHLPTYGDLLACLREVARVREATGCAVWLFDFARLRRETTMGTLLDLNPDAPEMLRFDGRASERAAWAPGEFRGALAEAGLHDLTGGRERVLGHLQAFGVVGRSGRPHGHGRWSAPPLPKDSAALVRRLRKGMPRPPVAPTPAR